MAIRQRNEGAVTEHDDAAARFGALYRDTHAAVLSTCIRRLGSREEAEDAAHEVFRIAWQRYPERNVGIDALHAMALEVTGREYRRSVRLRAALSRLAGVDHGHDLTEVLDVRAAVTQLRRVDRELLYLDYWEDLPAQEMALLLGISVGAVRVRLTRARRAVRALLSSGRRARPRAATR